MADPDTSRLNSLRALPSVDALLRTESARALRDRVGAQHLAELARAVTEELRARLREDAHTKNDGEEEARRELLLAEAERRLARAVEVEAATSLRRVINASGVILHTNLGRAPLSEAARRAIAEEAAGYCTLEYDTQTGARGLRGARVERLLTDLTGAEAALVVNNCAAAALLILTALAQSGETIVSRGELVEIGGDFRVPDVMLNSGTRLIEVGTTNRTRLSDYGQAITENTRLIMRVHPSNYRIVGFTAAPMLAELAHLAHESGLILYEDAGSGALSDLSSYGLESEPLISSSIRNGADLVSFSGDKLMGASQAGLIVGRRQLVDQLRRHSLYRALRTDKLTLAALEATLDAHRRTTSFSEIPVLRMIRMTAAEVRERAQNLVSKFVVGSYAAPALAFEIIEGQSAIGGGSAPLTHPRTALIALRHSTLTAERLEESLRLSSPAVITRIAEGRVLIDLRTVAEDEESHLLAALSSVPT